VNININTEFCRPSRLNKQETSLEKQAHAEEEEARARAALVESRYIVRNNGKAHIFTQLHSNQLPFYSWQGKGVNPEKVIFP
jgi:hypothetical protein